AVDRVRVDHLEEERARVLVSVVRPAAAQRWQRTADEAGDDLVDQGQTVTLVRSEGQERNRLVRIGGRVAVLVDRSQRREGFTLALELLHAAHRDDRRGPVDHDGEAERIGRREAPAVRIRPEGWKL